MTSITLAPLEAEVMNLLLAGEDPTLAILRDQLSASQIKNREFTGAGFYTAFDIPQHISRVPGKKSFKFGDVVGDIEGLKNGAGFVLFVKDGALDLLEGYSYDEPWPHHLRQFKLTYSGGVPRDIAVLSKKWI